ncbi:tyrosine-type recombinase/integrase [Actinomadura scrupuli]|uniref:tyrosine-type recombinase/integrase n=1 Tax=Actinomadura scrupuli TaxID=559629 RepID=UPI003D99AB07
MITKLYRDLLKTGGTDGKPLVHRAAYHAILRKAFGDAVLVDELIPNNPVDRAKRPKGQLREPGSVWTPAQLRTFLSAFSHLAAYTGARRGELLNLRWSNLDLDGLRITITGSTGVIGGERIEGTTKSGRSRVVTIDEETVIILKAHRKARAADQLLAGEEWHGAKDGYVFATG